MRDEQHRSALIPLYHMLATSKHTLYQKIGWGIKENFSISVNVIFWVKYRFFSLPVQDTASKIENSEVPSKVTHSLCDIGYKNYLDSPQGRFCPFFWSGTYVNPY